MAISDDSDGIAGRPAENEGEGQPGDDGRGRGRRDGRHPNAGGPARGGSGEAPIGRIGRGGRSGKFGDEGAGLGKAAEQAAQLGIGLQGLLDVTEPGRVQLAIEEGTQLEFIDGFHGRKGFGGGSEKGESSVPTSEGSVATTPAECS